ncbi:MAG: NAD(P)/FAD-dependent oxidoreductase [Sphingomonadales bacterium]|nr:NAD(P)/FAD-dependent oxidoreductase [Sphingomonadales bacterium]
MRIKEQTKKTDVIIIGAGAAGLMCAIEAGKRGRSVILLDHAKAVGEKIRISGGGRCNFTNINAKPENYISNNHHFAKSALARFEPSDFIKMVESYDIEYYEKTLGQLFCKDSARQIIDMLIKESDKAGVKMHLDTTVNNIVKIEGGYVVETSVGQMIAQSLVVACGGKSIPKMGATGFGYEIAKQFDINIIKPRPALVPLTFDNVTKETYAELAGVSVEVEVKSNTAKNSGQFREALLFTHRGLSGPAILQISSYWAEGDSITINLAPDTDVLTTLQSARQAGSKQTIVGLLSQFLPKRLAQHIAVEQKADATTPIAQISDKTLIPIAAAVNNWTLTPQGSEGFRTAEVTLGGVDTNELSSKTFEAKKADGLYFIGEVVDVTGHLGGYNFQWAWASGHAAGQCV